MRTRPEIEAEIKIAEGHVRELRLNLARSNPSVKSVIAEVLRTWETTLSGLRHELAEQAALDTVAKDL